LSVADLLFLLASRKNTPPPQAIDYSTMRADIIEDVKTTVRAEMNSGWNGIDNTNMGADLFDPYVESFANQQGAHFMRYIPGRTPTTM
jgi:hypothetical protein